MVDADAPHASCANAARRNLGGNAIHLKSAWGGDRTSTTTFRRFFALARTSRRHSIRGAASIDATVDDGAMMWVVSSRGFCSADGSRCSER